jgi:hypothetical protein
LEATALKWKVRFDCSPARVAVAGIALVSVKSLILVVVSHSDALLVPQASQYCVVASFAVTVPFSVAPDLPKPVVAFLVTDGTGILAATERGCVGGMR